MPYTPHVLVIGGGVLGTAIARDLAIRGFETTLVEQGTLTAGASGRMQGILYSGARFCADDPAGAKRCHTESQILRRIAGEYVRKTTGVIAAPAGAADELDELLAAAAECEIPAEELTGEALHATTDRLDDEFARGVRVEDAVIDPFRLTVANANGAERFGADVRTGAEVSELRFEGGRIAGATVAYSDGPSQRRPQPGDRSGIEPPEIEEEDEIEVPDEEEESKAPEPVAEIQRSFPGATEDHSPDPGTTDEIEADFVVNATGPWADRVAAMAGIDLPIERVRGTMAVLDGEVSDGIVSRYGDESRQITPFWGNTVLGAVAEPVEDADTAAEAVETLLADAESLFDLDDPGVVRTYTGLWTSHPGADAPARGPGATIVDHERHHDRWGMLTVLGGTLTTHRGVAENVVDRICREFGVNRGCRTADISLPSVDPEGEPGASVGGALKQATQAVSSVTNRGQGANPVLCENRGVRRDAVQEALDDRSSSGTDLTDVRLRTGATMGECQGGRCGHRLAAQLYPDQDESTVEEALSAFLGRRWAGRRTALWGERLRAAMRDYELHERTLARGGGEPDSLSAFDDGTESQRERERPMCCEAVRQ